MLRNVLATLALAGLAAGASGRAAADGRLHVYLADPQLGVVGSYVDGERRVYFDVRRAADGDAPAARLLDADGRTIATVGTALRDAWLVDERFDAAAAARSAALAGPLSPALAQALPGAEFAAETAALDRLARATAAADALHEPLIVEDAKAAPVSSPDAVRAFYARTGAELFAARQADGSARATFRDVVLQARTTTFPGELNEDGTATREELDARYASLDGRTLAAQYGGDRVPDDWPVDAPERAVPDLDTRFAEFGASVMAARALAQSDASGVSPLRADEREALVRVGTMLRDALLPQPGRATDDPDAKALPVVTATKWRVDLELWRKPLAAGLAEHSGTKVILYMKRGTEPLTRMTTYYYCNHGTCPGACSDSCMTRKCSYTGPLLTTQRLPPYRVVPSGQTGAGTAHSCNSGYGLDSFYRHNCHDDSWTQIRYVRGAAAHPDHYRCNDIGVHRSAPSCSD